MSNDIVKQILLRFRGDAKPLEKDLAEVKKTVASLDKAFGGGPGGSRGGGMAGMSKAIEQYSKVTQKFGMSMDKDLTKFGKHIRDIAMKDVGLLKKQTEDLFIKSSDNLKKVQDAERRYEDLKRTGGSSKQYRQAHNKLLRRQSEAASASGAFQESADELAERGGMIPANGGRSLRMGAGIAGTVIGAAVGISNASLEAERTQVQSQTQIGQSLMQRRMAQYGGDATEYLMEIKDRSLSKAKTYAESQTGWKADISQIGKALGLVIGGGIAGGWAGPWGIAGGAGMGAIAGGANLYSYYAGGGKQALYNQRLEEGIARDKQTQMTTAYYKNLYNKAPGRYDLQRQMRMSDEELMGMAGTAGANSFTEEEAGQTYMNLRSMFGNKAAKGMFGLGSQAMELSKNQGMGLDVATQLIGQTGYSGAGGTANAKKALGDIYSDAFAKGITDSGLIEAFQKGAANMAAQSPDVSDIESIARRMMSSLPQGQEPNARNVQGAITGEQAAQELSLAGGEQGILKQSKLATITNDISEVSILSGKTDQQIVDMAKDPNDYRLSDITKKKILQQYSPEQTLKNTLLKENVGHQAIDKFNAARKSGANYNQAVATASGSLQTAAGQTQLSKEAAFSLAQTAFGQLTPKELGLSPEDLQKYRATSPALPGAAPTKPGETRAGIIKAGTAQGQAELTQESITNVSTSDLKKAEEMRRTTSTPLGGDISASAQSLKAALDAFVTAVSNQSGTSATSTTAGAFHGH